MTAFKLESIPKDNLYYVAMPYTSISPMVVERRYLEALRISARFANEGFITIEPILMCHQQAQRFGLPGDFSFWEKRDIRLLEACDAVIVLLLQGWEQSHGVKREIEYALANTKPIYYYDPIFDVIYDEVPS